MPTLLLKAKKLKALACVRGVLFSVIIVLTVLHAVSIEPARSLSKDGGESDTTVPANTPAQHLKSIICQIVLLSPKVAVATATPAREKTRTGFLPMRSAARPH
jgi:hypothetical protein